MSTFVLKRPDGATWSAVAGGYIKGGKIVSTTPEYLGGSSSGGGGNNGMNSMQQRQQEMNNFRFSNLPDVADRERTWWEIYVKTGLTNTDAQNEAHQQAEQIRMQLNSQYKGAVAGVSDSALFGNNVVAPNTVARPGVMENVVGAVGNEAANQVQTATGKYNTNDLIGAAAGLGFIMVLVKIFTR